MKLNRNLWLLFAVGLIGVVSIQLILPLLRARIKEKPKLSV
jgi:capsular polysaccharide biosynthesis protein